MSKKYEMIEDVHLLGTGFKLTKGDRVIIERATNIPIKEYYFVRPPYGKWNDGIIRNISDSILVHESLIKERK